MALFGNKNKRGEFSIFFSSVRDSIPGIPEVFPIEVIMKEDCLEFKRRFSKKDPVYLKYEQITNFGKVSEKEIIEKGKSVIGRAAVGGLVLGPLGAIIGAVDGTGKKTKATYHNYFIINYNSTSGENTAISVEIDGTTFGVDKFIEELARVTNVDVAAAGPKYL